MKSEVQRSRKAVAVALNKVTIDLEEDVSELRTDAGEKGPLFAYI